MTKASEINLDTAYAGNQHSQHRRPREAAAADRYYGRRYQPNFAYNGYTFREAEMTKEQQAEYYYGWANEHDRKDWGGNVDADRSDEAETAEA